MFSSPFFSIRILIIFSMCEILLHPFFVFVFFACFAIALQAVDFVLVTVFLGKPYFTFDTMLIHIHNVNRFVLKYNKFQTIQRLGLQSNLP